MLGINAFDQPDVQDSKLRTLAKIKDFQQTGKLAEVDLTDAKDAKKVLHDLLANAKENSYVAINAYVPRNKEMISAFKRLFPRANKQLDILYALKVD